jgi:hypothetical protein
MTDPNQDEDADEDVVLEGAEGVLDGELSLDDLEELEEDANAGHRVTTFDPGSDGEAFFDGAYFDQ